MNPENKPPSTNTKLSITVLATENSKDVFQEEGVRERMFSLSYESTSGVVVLDI